MMKKLLRVAALVLPAIVVLIILQSSKVNADQLCSIGLCSGVIHNYISNLGLPLLVVAIMAIIASFFREEIFNEWFLFAIKWTPVAVILIVLSPYRRGGAGFFSSVQETLSFVLPVIFILWSAFIIGLKLSRPRQKKR